MAQRNDIEDVLSSIRRLVADEAGPAVEVQASRALLLDQAQRVTEPEDPFQTVQGPPAFSLTDDVVEEEEAAVAAPNIDDFEFEARRSPALRMAAGPMVLEPAVGLEDDEPDATSDPAFEGDTFEDLGDETDPVDLSDLSDGIESDEALRDLIAEIVRQELAGALGERITRNVRKLVRRELRQMMSGEEFD